MEERRGSGWYQMGCYGCLGALAVLLLVALVLFALQQRGADSSEWVSEREMQPLPGEPAIRPAEPATAEQVADAGGPSELVLPEAEVGTVRLDLRMGLFTVEPGSPGGDVEVEAEYDAGSFELVRELVEEEGSWTLTIRFRPKRLFLFGDNSGNQVIVRLPPDRPLRLEGDLRMGRSELELGGLWLEGVDLDVRMGEHTVRFSEPTAAPLEVFEMAGRMGRIEVDDLGNASPASVAFSHRMGESELGLEGAWRNDSKVAVRSAMGRCVVSTPEGVRVVADSEMFAGEGGVDRRSRELPADAPTLEIVARGSMGQLEIE